MDNTLRGTGQQRSLIRRALPAMLMGGVMNPINTSIIAVALVPIAVAFGAPATDTAWLVSGLYLATVIGQPLAGRLVDVFGSRRIFLIGAALVFVSGIIGMAAPNIWVLVVARVILGLGTTAAYPASLSLLGEISNRSGVPTPSFVLASLAVASQTVAVVGPTVGGLLIDAGGWRLTLAVNIPLGVAVFVLGWFLLPRGYDPVRSDQKVQIDLAGMGLFVVAMVSLLLFVSNISAVTALLIPVAVLATIAFTIRELRADSPFIDLRLLAGNGPVLMTYGRQFFAAFITYAFVFGATQWLQGGRGLSPSEAGLVLLPSFGAGLIAATVTGRTPAFRAKLIVAAVAQLVGCVAMLFLSDDASIWFIVAIAIALGSAQGLTNVGLQSALYAHADPAQMGSSAGLLRTFLFLGAIVSSAIGGIAFASGTGAEQLTLLTKVMLGAAVVFAIMLFVRARDTTRD